MKWKVGKAYRNAGVAYIPFREIHADNRFALEVWWYSDTGSEGVRVLDRYQRCTLSEDELTAEEKLRLVRLITRRVTNVTY